MGFSTRLLTEPGPKWEMMRTSLDVSGRGTAVFLPQGVQARLGSRCGHRSLQGSVSRRKREGSQGSLEWLSLRSMEGRGCGQRLKVLMAQSQESQELVPRLGTAGVKRSVGPYRPTQWYLGTNKDQTLGTGPNRTGIYPGSSCDPFAVCNAGPVKHWWRRGCPPKCALSGM